MTTSTALGYADLPHLLGLQTGDEKHDWSCPLDARRALGPVRPCARRRPFAARRPRARPLPAFEGARADGVLRRARGKGLHPRRVARRLRRRTTRRSATTPTTCSCPASRSRAARSATACRSPRAWRSRSTPGASMSTRLLPRRRRRARRGQQLGGRAARRPALDLDASPRSSSTTRRGRTAGPAASSGGSRSRAGTSHAWTAVTTTRWRLPSTSGGERPRCVVAEVIA